MKHCSICDQPFYCYFLDDEICVSCELAAEREAGKAQSYDNMTVFELEQERAWAESDCHHCGLPNPICECEDES